MLPTNQASSLSSDRWLISIRIETLAGSSFELLVPPHEQIQSIKRRIEQQEGIPASHQHLIWKSSELADEDCLNDHQIESGATLRLVLAMRGGPVNTKRVPIEDSYIRDPSEYIESGRDDSEANSDLLSSSNKNVTFLVLRDGDQFTFYRLIDRGDDAISPLFGSASNASMYNTQDTITGETENEYDEKRQTDDRKTKQKMELIRSKLKAHNRKEPLPMRPPSATKPSPIQQASKNILADKNPNLAIKTIQSSANLGTETARSIPITYSSTNLLSSSNILSSAPRRVASLLNDDDSDDDDDSHDDDDEQPIIWQSQHPSLSSSQQPVLTMNQKKHMLTSRSFSPALFYRKNNQQSENDSSKKTIYHSHYQDRTTKNLVTKHENSGSLESYAPNSIDAMLSTRFPTVALGPVTQETAISTSATATAAGTDTSTSAVLVDYIPRISPTLHKQQVPVVARTSRILSAYSSKHLNASDETTLAADVDLVTSKQGEPIASNSEILYQTSHQSPAVELLEDDRISPRNGLTSAASLCADKSGISRKQTAEVQSRNDTALSRAIWTDDDDQLLISDDYIPGERTSTSQSMLFRHRNSSTSTTIATPAPTFPSVVKKSTLPSTTQKFYHHHQTINSETQNSKNSPRTSVPISLPKYRRHPSNIHFSTSSTQQTSYTSTGKISSSDVLSNGYPNSSNNNESFNEHLMLNKRIETLKTPAKSTQSTAPSPSFSSTTTIFPSSSSLSKRNFPPQDMKPVGTTSNIPSSLSSHNPLDNTTVTIESIGPKTVSSLLRQNATIEPVDTSRGVGKHLYSLLTTVSKENTSLKAGHKHSSRDAVIEDRYKFDNKSTNPWSNSTSTNTTTVNSTIQSTTTNTTNSINKLPPVNVNRKSTSKCFLCKKKTGLATTYSCRCGSSFCSEHRYPEAHACAFDYKAEGKRLIERNNPLVTAPKLPKI